MAAQFFLIGDGACGGCAHFDQRLFHFQNDHADHLGRVFGPVQDFGDVRGDDVSRAGENTHQAYS